MTQNSFKYSVLTIFCGYCVSAIVYDVMIFTFNVVFPLLSMMPIGHELVVEIDLQNRNGLK